MFRDALSPSVNSLKFPRRPVVYCHESHPHPSLIPYTTSNVCIFNLCSRWSLIISVQQTTYWNTTTYITMRSDLSLSNNALRRPYGTRITFSHSALIDVNKFEIRLYLHVSSSYHTVRDEWWPATNPILVPYSIKGYSKGWKGAI